MISRTLSMTLTMLTLRIFGFPIDGDQNAGLTIVQGDFEFDVVREDPKAGADCEADNYPKVELWQRPDGGVATVFETALPPMPKHLKTMAGVVGNRLSEYLSHGFAIHNELAQNRPTLTAATGFRLRLRR